MNTPSLAKRNRIALALLIVAAALAIIIAAMPVYSFTSSVYTLKSPNTFVGDESYTQALATVNAAAEEYRAQGLDVTVEETVTERTNSKGVTTSLVTFTVEQSFEKSALSFLGAGLHSSWVMAGILLCLALSVICAVLGLLSSADTEYRLLGGRARTLRSAAGILALLAMLMVPVFVMMNTYALARQISLFCSGNLTEGREAFFAALDSFLFGGGLGDNLESALKGLTFELSGLIWLMLPCFFAMIVAAVQLRFGTVKHTLLRGLLYAFVAVVAIITLYPYYVMFITAFRSNAETTDMYFLHMLPTEWKFGNIVDIVRRGVPRYLLNSLIIAGGGTLVAMLCGIPAAYAMARMKFKGRKAFLGFVIMSQMFAPVVLLIGISQLISTLKMTDTLIGLVLINAAFNQAFAIWLLRGTFVSISPEMEQAALIDGCSTTGSLIRILLPMAAPGIVTALIFVFINAWNEYTIATVLIATASNRPITVGITQFSSFNMIEWPYLFAASLLATIPVVILFASIEKHLTAGLTSGGVKG